MIREATCLSQIVFTVQSETSGELYHLEATRTARGVRFTCTCQAGQKGSHCKHRLAVLLDDTSSCVDVDEAAVAALRYLTTGSELMALVATMTEAERAVQVAEAHFKKVKKAVGKALAG